MECLAFSITNVNKLINEEKRRGGARIWLLFFQDNTGVLSTTASIKREKIEIDPSLPFALLQITSRPLIRPQLTTQRTWIFGEKSLSWNSIPTESIANNSSSLNFFENASTKLNGGQVLNSLLTFSKEDQSEMHELNGIFKSSDIFRALSKPINPNIGINHGNSQPKLSDLATLLSHIGDQPFMETHFHQFAKQFGLEKLSNQQVIFS